jgi:hypothetical protein
MCKKIDIYVKDGKEFVYKCSTNSAKRCKKVIFQKGRLKMYTYNVYQLNTRIFSSDDELVANEYARLTNHISGVKCTVERKRIKNLK